MRDEAARSRQSRREPACGRWQLVRVTSSNVGEVEQRRRHCRDPPASTGRRSPGSRSARAVPPAVAADSTMIFAPSLRARPSTPVNALVRPGPVVVKTTTGRSLAKCASTAANAAPLSWRKWRTAERALRQSVPQRRHGAARDAERVAHAELPEHPGPRRPPSVAGADSLEHVASASRWSISVLRSRGSQKACRAARSVMRKGGGFDARHGMTSVRRGNTPARRTPLPGTQSTPQLRQQAAEPSGRRQSVSAGKRRSPLRASRHQGRRRAGSRRSARTVADTRTGPADGRGCAEASAASRAGAEAKPRRPSRPGAATASSRASTAPAPRRNSRSSLPRGSRPSSTTAPARPLPRRRAPKPSAFRSYTNPARRLVGDDVDEPDRCARDARRAPTPSAPRSTSGYVTPSGCSGCSRSRRGSSPSAPLRRPRGRAGIRRPRRDNHRRWPEARLDEADVLGKVRREDDDLVAGIEDGAEHDLQSAGRAACQIHGIRLRPRSPAVSESVRRHARPGRPRSRRCPCSDAGRGFLGDEPGAGPSATSGDGSRSGLPSDRSMMSRSGRARAASRPHSNRLSGGEPDAHHGARSAGEDLARPCPGVWPWTQGAGRAVCDERRSLTRSSGAAWADERRTLTSGGTGGGSCG